MDARKALLDALDLQVEVAGGIPAALLPVASTCPGWSVRDVMNHSIGVTQKFADFAAGRTDEPHAPPQDLVGADHVAALRGVRDAARAAWIAAGRAG